MVGIFLLFNGTEQPQTSQLQQHCLGYVLDIDLVLLHSSVPASPLNFH